MQGISPLGGGVRIGRWRRRRRSERQLCIIYGVVNDMQKKNKNKRFALKERKKQTKLRIGWVNFKFGSSGI